MKFNLEIYLIHINNIKFYTYRKYGGTTRTVAKQGMQLTLHYNVWPTEHLLPHIMVTKPRSDLCWMCHQNSIAIMKVANKLDDDKVKIQQYKLLMFLIALYKLCAIFWVLSKGFPSL